VKAGALDFSRIIRWLSRGSGRVIARLSRASRRKIIGTELAGQLASRQSAPEARRISFQGSIHEI
jgi:hypothetical protein